MQSQTPQCQRPGIEVSKLAALCFCGLRTSLGSHSPVLEGETNSGNRNGGQWVGAPGSSGVVEMPPHQAPLEKGRRRLHMAQATERKGHGGESSHCVLSRVGAGSCSSRTLCSAQAPTQAQEALFWGMGLALCLALLELRTLGVETLRGWSNLSRP